MSRENLEFVEGLLAGAGATDKQTLLSMLPELVVETCAPDVEWVEDPQRPDSHTYRGHEGVQRSWERWLEGWDEWGWELERAVDHGDDVLVTVREHGRGATSGASVSSRLYMAFTIRRGKIVRYREFYDEQAALRAVGPAG